MHFENQQVPLPLLNSILRLEEEQEIKAGTFMHVLM
jgi:hypothetical protein